VSDTDVRSFDDMIFLLDVESAWEEATRSGVRKADRASALLSELCEQYFVPRRLSRDQQLKRRP
jgi:hypothetical protein